MRLLIVFVLLQVPVISKYLSYREATKSAYAASSTNANAPTPEQLDLIRSFGKNYFDPLRISVGSPLYVSSLYRSEEVNKKVGGATHSEHLIRNNVVACDIDQDEKGKIGNRALFFFIRDKTQFRKLIWEFGTETRPAWVHVSWSPDPTKNIKKVYRAIRVNNRIIYLNFDTIYE